MNDIEIAIEDLDTLVELARQNMTTGNWLGITYSANLIRDMLERQLHNSWILCSERLPDETGYYNISMNSSPQVYTAYYTKGDFYYWMSQTKIDFVIAWQPLPEPYKEKDGVK